MRGGAALLLLLGAVQGVRIEVGKFGISPRAPEVEYFNPYSSGLPSPIMEDPEPENRVLTPPGARNFGLQIDNVVSALSYRYPNPPTTPRPNSIQAFYPLPEGVPSAFAAPRPARLPTLPRPPQQLVSQDGFDPLLADPTLYHSQLAQQQVIQQKADVIQQQRQSQAAQTQIQIANQRLQMREIMRQNIRARLEQQRQEDAYRQQFGPAPQISQTQPLYETQGWQAEQPWFEQQPQQFNGNVPITPYFDSQRLKK